MPDSYDPPVSGGPHDPYEKYRVTEIHGDEEAANSQKRDREPEDRSAFAVYATFIFNKFIELFERTSEQGLTASAENAVLDHLIMFKAAIETLKIEDRSQDPGFLNKLADIWHQLLDDSFRFRRQTPLAIKMRAFIKGLQHYPEHHEHSLGYYLTEYAGQKWLPFPYMEMLLKLHVLHKKDPQGGPLSSWSNAIEEMIQMLRPAEKPKDPSQSIETDA